MLSEILFEKCEEFFDLIATEYKTYEVNEVIDSLTEYLISEIDGQTRHENYEVAEEVELRLREIWDLIPFDERRTNYNLRDYYDDILETAARIFDGNEEDDDTGEWDELSEYEDEMNEEDEC